MKMKICNIKIDNQIIPGYRDYFDMIFCEKTNLLFKLRIVTCSIFLGALIDKISLIGTMCTFTLLLVAANRSSGNHFLTI